MKFEKTIVTGKKKYVKNKKEKMCYVISSKETDSYI